MDNARSPARPPVQEYRVKTEIAKGVEEKGSFRKKAAS